MHMQTMESIVVNGSVHTTTAKDVHKSAFASCVLEVSRLNEFRTRILVPQKSQALKTFNSGFCTWMFLVVLNLKLHRVSSSSSAAPYNRISWVCDGRRDCLMSALNSAFGDLCASSEYYESVDYYLKVNYSCQGKPGAKQYEGVKSSSAISLRAAHWETFPRLSMAH